MKHLRFSLSSLDAFLLYVFYKREKKEYEMKTIETLQKRIKALHSLRKGAIKTYKNAVLTDIDIDLIRTRKELISALYVK